MAGIKFTNRATGKSFTLVPRSVPPIPIGGYNPAQVAKRASRKKAKKKSKRI